MDNVTLPPELARFADDAVAAGRYRNLSELIAHGVRLVQQREQARAAFVASLEAAEAAGEREGCFTIEEVHREMSELIDELDRAHL